MEDGNSKKLDDLQPGCSMVALGECRLVDLGDEMLCVKHVDRWAKPNAPKTIHVWYSKKQAAVAGTCLYRSPSGGTLEVSEAHFDATYKPNWDDAVYLGEAITARLGGYLGRSRPAALSEADTTDCLRRFYEAFGSKGLDLAEKFLILKEKGIF